MHLVFVDANILYSRTLRDWTLLMSMTSHRYSVVTSEDAIIEVLANFRTNNPTLSGNSIRRLRDRIENSLADVITDWPGGHVKGMHDEKDMHIVNAATHAQADILLTENIKDFAPVASSLPFDLYTADDLFMLLATNDPEAVLRTTAEQAQYWSKKAEEAAHERRAGQTAKAPKRLAQALRDAGAPKFAAHVEQLLPKLSGVGLHQDAPAASSTH